MESHIDEMFESFVRGSIVLLVNGSLNLCKEIFKFFLILLFLYYLALRSFEFLDELSLTIPLPTEFSNKSQYNLKTDEYGLETHLVVGETRLRIGAPHENLIKQRATLLEQLEIEAEFEENIKHEIKSETSFNKPEFHSTPIKTRNSDKIDSFKDLFISQIKRESNEISRPSQTTKTSLGKKSKPREKILENEPQVNSTLNGQAEDGALWQIINIRSETDTDAVRTTTSKQQETQSSYDEQMDHESFHRV